MDVGPRRTLQGLGGALDQVLTGLGQHGDGDVVGDRVVRDQLVDEVEVGLRSRREADLDLLVAHPHQQVEQLLLAAGGHRVDQRLVAVTQVGGQPTRRLGDLLVRPGAVGQRHGLEGVVALDRHAARLLDRAGLRHRAERTGEGHGGGAGLGNGVGGHFLPRCQEWRDGTLRLRSEEADLSRPRCGKEGESGPVPRQ
ncbi:hypothetical protein SDC9_155284 [bioreactor metagenome]|uniref:Uncharacterized protein n=1 Tax=bioreactor metagenome TaxID=1076179 RepID=A0A645F108_9ZZZZ